MNHEEFKRLEKGRGLIDRIEAAERSAQTVADTAIERGIQVKLAGHERYGDILGVSRACFDRVREMVIKDLRAQQEKLQVEFDEL
jgi:hypothetical protein